MTPIYFLKKFHECSKNIVKETGRSHLYNYFDYTLAFLFHGCSIRQYYYGGFYKLPSYMRYRSVTYKRWYTLMDTFNDSQYIHFLENKVEFLQYFKKYVSRDWYYPKLCSKDLFKLFAGRNKQFIVKPVNELQGKGVKIIHISDYSCLDELYEKIVSEDLLCEELIEQHPRMFFQNCSVNTIRVFTVLDKSNIAHVITTVLRVGQGDSVVDNFCAGGVVYPVDVVTGIVYDKGIDGEGNEYMIHPGSDLCMLGFKVPNWDLAMSFITEVAQALPQTRFVGWDIAITTNGVDLVEGNHNPDHEFLEFLGERGTYLKFMQYK